MQAEGSSSSISSKHVAPLLAPHKPHTSQKTPKMSIVTPTTSALIKSPKMSSSSNNLRKERKPVCKWTEKEDLLMTKLVQKYGTRHWTIIGTKLPGRNGKQCRERCVLAWAFPYFHM